MRAGKKQLPVGDHNSSARSSRNTDTVPKIEPHPPRGGLGPPGNTSTGKAGQGRAGPPLPSGSARRRSREDEEEKGGVPYLAALRGTLPARRDAGRGRARHRHSGARPDRSAEQGEQKAAAAIALCRAEAPPPGGTGEGGAGRCDGQRGWAVHSLPDGR